MNAAARRALGALAVWVLLSGCFLVPRNNDPDPLPIDDEGCDDNHASFWAPADEGVEILADAGPADGQCNRLSFHSGGGAQGGDVFHVEPVLRFTNQQEPFDSVITWEYRDPDTDELLGSQSFEVYEDYLRAVDGGWEHRGRLLINPDDRGKNRKLVAYAELPAETGTTLQVQAEAAVYIVPQ